MPLCIAAVMPNTARTLHLRQHALRVGHDSRNRRRVRLRHPHRPVRADLGVDDSGDIADEAPVPGDAERLACGKRLAPARFRGGELDHVAAGAPYRSGTPPIGSPWFQKSCAMPGGLPVELARRADHLEQKVLLVAAELGGELRHDRLLRERARDVRHGAEPTDPRMRQRLALLGADVGNVEGDILEAHADLDRMLHALVRREGRQERRLRAPVPPRDRLVAVHRGRSRSAPPRWCGGSCAGCRPRGSIARGPARRPRATGTPPRWRSRPSTSAQSRRRAA